MCSSDLFFACGLRQHVFADKIDDHSVNCSGLYRRVYEYPFCSSKKRKFGSCMKKADIVQSCCTGGVALKNWLIGPIAGCGILKVFTRLCILFLRAMTTCRYNAFRVFPLFSGRWPTFSSLLTSIFRQCVYPLFSDFGNIYSNGLIFRNKSKLVAVAPDI